MSFDPKDRASRRAIGKRVILETQEELEDQLDEFYDTYADEGEQDPHYLRASALTVLKRDALVGETASVDFGASLVLFLCVQEDALRAEFEERIARLRQELGLPLETDEDVTFN